MVRTAAPGVAQQPAPPTARAPRPRRGLLSRFSAAHGLMVASAMLAFVLVAVVLGDRDETVVVAVARADMAPGDVVTAADVRWSELPASSPLARQFVARADLAGTAWVAAGPVAAGQPLRRSDLVPPAAADGLRSLSIPVAKEHAVGGALRAGDRVDVIDVTDTGASYAAAGLSVAKVAGTASAGGITAGSGRDYFVVVRVDAEQALALARAMADGKVEVVRSTGALPVPVPSPEPPEAVAPVSTQLSPVGAPLNEAPSTQAPPP